MKKILLVWILTFILLTFSSFAVLTDADLYFSFDDANNTGSNPDDISGNGNDGTNNGATIGVAGKLLEAYDYNGSNEFVSYPVLGIFDGSTNYTINSWIKWDNPGSEDKIIAMRAERNIFVGANGNVNTISFLIFDGAVAHEVTTGALNSGQFYMITARYDSTNGMEIFLDGVSVDTDAFTGTAQVKSDSTNNIGVNTGSQFWDGIIDELAIYPRAILDSEITTLFNNNNSFNPYTAVPDANFTITGEDIFDGTSLSDLNVTIDLDNGTTINLANSTGNFIQTNIPNNFTGLANITTRSTNYFNNTIINYNLSSNLIANLSQSEIRFNATDILNNSITGNFTINSVVKNTGEIFNLRATTYNVTFQNASFFSQTQLITIVPFQNETITVENVSNGVINVNATDVLGNPILNFTATAVANDSTISLLQSTTSGLISFGLLGSKTYNITINATGFALFNNTVNIELNDTDNVTKQFSLFQENSVLFLIRDEVTNLEVFIPFTIQLVGPTTEENITNQSQIEYNLLIPSEYTVRWVSTNSSDFDLRTKIFTVTSQSFQQVTLFVQNISAVNTVNVIFQVFDETLEVFEGATLTVARYSSSAEGYQDIASKITDSNGNAIFILEEVNAFYRYRVDFQGSTLFISDPSGEQFIDAQNVGFVEVPVFVNKQTTFFDNLDEIDDISSSLIFTNTSNLTGFFDFVTSSSSIFRYCLNLQETANGVLTERQTCQTTNSANIILAVNTTSNTQKTITATGTVELSDGTIYLIRSLTIILNPTTPSDNEDFKKNASFAAMIAVVLVLSFTEVPSFGLLFIVIIIMALGLTVFAISGITLAVGAVLMILALIISSTMRRRV